MSESDQIKSAIESNSLLPSKQELKRMMRLNRWDEIGKLFGFTPKYHFGIIGQPGKWIDWSCIPTRMLNILRTHPHSVQLSHRLPKRQRHKAHPKVRDLIYTYQEGVCHYCKKLIPPSAWSVDHLIPLCRGGSNKIENKVGACKTCNHAKSSLTEKEFLETPLKDRKARIKAVNAALKVVMAK